MATPTAAEKIAQAIAQNPDHDEEGLTCVDARWTVEVAAIVANTTRITGDLAKGAKNALKGHPEGTPLMVFCKTHDLRHLIEQLPPSPPPATPAAAAESVPAAEPLPAAAESKETNDGPPQ